MRSLRIWGAPLGIVFALLAQSVVAQQATTVGALLDKGGKILTKEEVVQLLSGATMSGQQLSNETSFENVFSADGLVKGKAALSDGTPVTIEGRWSVESNGRYVSNLSNSRGARWTSMTIFIKDGDVYYVAENDGRGATAKARTIHRAN